MSSRNKVIRFVYYMQEFFIIFCFLDCIYLMNLQPPVLNFSLETPLKFLYVCLIRFHTKHLLPAFVKQRHAHYNHTVAGIAQKAQAVPWLDFIMNCRKVRALFPAMATIISLAECTHRYCGPQSLLSREQCRFSFRN